LEDAGKRPEIVEIPYPLMQIMYQHGKIEPLNITEPDLQDLVVKAPDGSVIGVKAKINPLVVYYNRDMFDVMGLEHPSEDWDWNMLDQTIAALKAAKYKVHIMMSPFTLEWLAMNRYGGRISDPVNMMFAGYLDGERSVQAAEWFAWVGTKREDFDHAVPQTSMTTMPYVLINGAAALSVDYAHRLHGRFHYEHIIEQNDRIAIAPLPGGIDTRNLAQVTGLAVLSGSANKGDAMQLLRHLLKDRDQYWQDMAAYSMQGWQGTELQKDMPDPERTSIILQEMKRSEPSSLFFSENHLSGWNYNTPYIYPQFREIMDGTPPRQALEHYAQQLDALFGSFLQDPEAYGKCVRDKGSLCAY
jgi:hypothetical protein